jgi:type III secretion system-like peptide-binding chaperone
MILDDDPGTADLREKVAQAWREFARSLADALPGLPAGACLDLTLDPTASGTGDAQYAVTVTAADGRLAARAVGNASLPAGFQLNRAAIADMVALGWSPPGVEPESRDQFGLTAAGDSAPQLATVLTRTLRDIYGAPHPAFLVYLAYDEQSEEPVPVSPLGTARAAAALGTARLPPAPAEDDPARLREQVHTVVAAMQQTTPDKLMADADGDIGIRAGTAMVFVKVRENPPLVDVFSPILTEVQPSEKLYGRLSELTNRMPVGRLYCVNETVWASVPVFGRNFQPSHLVLAVQVMMGLADELDDRLHGEFGGRRFFAEDDIPPHHSPSTGMYL